MGLATFITVYCLKRKGIICISKKQKDEVIVHQNELYGNLSNQDYFEERYDTNILDRNQYYEEEYEAWINILKRKLDNLQFLNQKYFTFTINYKAIHLKKSTLLFVYCLNSFHLIG